MCEEKGTGYYANHVEEVAGKKEVMNVFEYEYETKNEKGKSRTIRFCWITNIEVTKRNLEEMILAGRGRWKIENEGFNNQKNGIYRIEHLNSRNSNAMKNHYLITQIADILMQMYENGDKGVKELKYTIKHIAEELLESLRKQSLELEDFIFKKMQIRRE